MSASELAALAPFTAGEPLPLPRAASVMLWVGAFLRGDIGPDDAVAAAGGSGHRALSPADTASDAGILAADGGSDTGSVPADAVDLFSWMVDLRRLDGAALSLVLPVPGRIQGLVPPPAAITAALEAEQAIVVSTRGLAHHTLVPDLHETPRGVDVQWRQFPSPPRPVRPATSGTAREELLRALREAARSSLDLDMVPEEPVAPARIPASWTAAAPPRHVDGPALHLMVLASRVLLLARAELDALDRDRDQGQPGVMLSERRTVLRELADAARAALMETVTLQVR